MERNFKKASWRIFWVSFLQVKKFSLLFLPVCCLVFLFFGHIFVATDSSVWSFDNSTDLQFVREVYALVDENTGCEEAVCGSEPGVRLAGTTGTLLCIVGTNGADNIQISKYRNKWKVAGDFDKDADDWSVEEYFKKIEVDLISVALYAGDDSFQSGADEYSVIYGGAGDDQVEGGKGDDVIYGGAGDDQIQGNKGDDILWGNEGSNDLQGGKGDDIIEGQEEGQGEIVLTEEEVCGFENILNCEVEDDKVTICHVPFGNFDNPKTLSVGLRALSRHINHFGDYCGECQGEDSFPVISEINLVPLDGYADQFRVDYTLSDPQSSEVSFVVDASQVQYSQDGVTNWQNASIYGQTENITTAPDGVVHDASFEPLYWDAAAVPKDSVYYLRLQPRNALGEVGEYGVSSNAVDLNFAAWDIFMRHRKTVIDGQLVYW